MRGAHEHRAAASGQFTASEGVTNLRPWRRNLRAPRTWAPSNTTAGESDLDTDGRSDGIPSQAARKRHGSAAGSAWGTRQQENYAQRHPATGYTAARQ